MNGKIYIPKPCHENWNKMTQEDKGRHCAVCSKVVTDFTKMQTDEIVKSLKSTDGEVCGRININQLTATNKKQQFYFWIKGTLIPKIRYATFAIFGLASIFKKSVYAQQALPGQITIYGGVGANYQAQTTEKKKVNIEVVNENNEPVMNAFVRVIKNGVDVLNTQADKSGKISGEVEMEQVGYSFITIIVSVKGYETKEIKDIRIVKNGQTIRVKLDENMIIMGKMERSDYHVPDPIINEDETPIKEEPIVIYRENINLINTESEIAILCVQEVNFTSEINTKEVPWTSILGKNPQAMSFVAFPNPTLGDITIETKQEDAFDIKIYNENGILILQETNQNKRAVVQLQDYAAGTYFAIIFINNKAIETHKIILVK